MELIKLKSKKNWITVVFLGLILVIGYFSFYENKENIVMEPLKEKENEIFLPQPQQTGDFSIERALSERRSIRDYEDEPLSLKEVSQILWSAQGITAPQSGGRTVPSAGATYPLEVYLVVRKAESLTPGSYRYLPEKHKLVRISEGQLSSQLAEAALFQMFIAEAPVNLVFSAVFERTTRGYGDRGIQYVYMEAGHAAQNVYLQAESLGLGTVVVGAFEDEEIKKILALPEQEIPLYIMPVGKIK